MPSRKVAIVAAFALTILVSTAVSGIFGPVTAHAASPTVSITNIAAKYVTTTKKTKTIKYKVKPGKTKILKVKFSSSKESVATVSPKGKVKTKRSGTTYIRVKVKLKKSGKWIKASVKFYVNIKASKVKVVSDESTIFKNTNSQTTTKARATVSPSYAYNRKVTWSSSNKKVATVTRYGTVKPVAPGSVRIYATAQDGSKKQGSVNIKVRKVGQDETLIIAHRGLSSVAPENTLAAFRLAITTGFDGVECDVWETAPETNSTEDEPDGALARPGLAIMHDQDLSRMCGPAGNGVLINQRTLAQLQSMRITAGNGNDEYPNEHIPSLEEYLALFAKKTAVPVIEIKTASTKKTDAFSKEAAQELVRQVVDRGLEDRAILQCFNTYSLENVLEAEAKAGCHINTLLLSSKKDLQATDSIVNDLVAKGLDGINLSKAAFNDENLGYIHQLNLKLGVWTVDDYSKSIYFIEQLKVDYFTTNVVL